MISSSPDCENLQVFLLIRKIEIDLSVIAMVTGH